MLMQVFSLSGFGVNSSHNDTRALLHRDFLSWDTNMRAAVAKSISIVNTGLMKIQSLLMQEGPEHWVNHCLMLSGSAPNP